MNIIQLYINMGGPTDILLVLGFCLINIESTKTYMVV